MNILMQEYDHEKPDTRQRMTKIFSRRSRPASAVDVNSSQSSSQDSTSYTYFEMTHVPFDVDYFQSFFALCDVFVAAYSKFVDSTEHLCNQAFADAIFKIDSKVKKIITPIMKEIDSIARTLLNDELKYIDPAFNFVKTSEEQRAG
ncbi:hypothetical protein HK102_003250 [Quaeritorhiza haematococci]|nr:hypothetical protein HK102_003250 [Quaeritorhiza haematococci]